MKIKMSILTITFALYGNVLIAHDQPVHVAITDAAVDSVSASPSIYVDFLNIVSSDISASAARLDLSQGSFHEDDRDKDAGGKRSLNHFYDPLTGLGLSETPLGGGPPLGVDSFTWASRLNGAGISLSYNPNPINEHSWQNARNNEWNGLTAINQADRQLALNTMFTNIGQVMHLLEDTSQPQHVRNEQHLDTWWVGGPNTPWRSPIEDYYKTHSISYPEGVLDWNSAGFKKLEDFWNRHLYNGSSSALQSAENGGAQLGLAEWCNGNFLGARHLFPEYYKPGDIEYYPFPSRDHSTDYSDVKLHPENHVSDVTLENNVTGKAIYLKKTGDGITYDHIARVNYLGAKIHGLKGTPYCTIDDPNVLKDYHVAFIPKAVKYSAGLLDYYFRGTLSIDCGDSTSGQIGITIGNTSGQDFSGGQFHLFWDDANGVRSEIASPNFSTTYNNVTLANGTSINATFVPANGAVDYIIVYQGTIGVTSGNASDRVDSGIAIATSQKLSSPDWSQLEWGVEWGGPYYNNSQGESFSPATGPSASGTMTATAFLDDGGYSISGVVENVGALNYKGGFCISKFHLDATGSPDGEVQVTITSALHGILFYDAYSGNQDIGQQFCIPGTSGQNDTISVDFFGVTGGYPNQLSATLTLSKP